jgi:hypothetical protein
LELGTTTGETLSRLAAMMNQSGDDAHASG